jgi:uncharacterized protein YecE (DUF72 family)
MSALPLEVLLGPIGFGYDEWNGWFYPRGLATRGRLSHLSTQFTLVELDTTFYRVPPVGLLISWSRQVPHDFVFILKAPQEITHKVSSEREGMQFWKWFLGALESMLPVEVHPFLQFPRGFSPDRVGYLASLIEQSGTWRDRLIVEVRDPLWKPEDLRGFGVVVAACDRAGLGLAEEEPRPGEFVPWPYLGTGNFAFLRLNGRHGQYERDNREVVDPSLRLEWWRRELLAGLPPGRRVLISCGNSYAGCAPMTLARVRRMLGLPEPPPVQGSLFG